MTGDSMTKENSIEEGKRERRRRRMPRGKVTVFPNWCKGCKLGDDGRVIVAQPERCTACRWCELHCPDFAIFVSDIDQAPDHQQSGEETE